MSDFARDGFCVVPNWLPSVGVQAVLSDAVALHDAGLSRAAAVGSTGHGNRGLREQVRRSRMAPLIPPPRPSAGCIDTRMHLYNQISYLRQELSSNPALQLPPLEPFHTELSYLYYPRGGFYKRHIDVPAQGGGWQRLGRSEEDGGSFSGAALRREVSMLLYLNSGWSPEWGGALRMYPNGCDGGNDRHIDVFPEGGTLVLMRSDRVPHEVCVTHRERQCLVGWFRTMQTR
jgi:SM-20-related protein